MQFLVLVTALLSSVAVAQQSLSSTVNRQCATRYSLKPTSTIRTTTYRASTTRTIGRTVVVNPRTTVTAAAATLVTTRTVGQFSTVTAASSTDTFTSFQTATSTSTFVVTQGFTTATTVLSTTTVPGVTSTRPTPAGFTALADTPGYFPKKRGAVIERSLEQRQSKAQGHIPLLPEAGSKMAKRQASAQREYPVGIQCTSRTTFFSTRTATSTQAGVTSTVTAARSTVVRTITVTSTGVRTVIPADATRIITVTTGVSATVTSTSTTVTTLSATVTIQAPAATLLAQCAANNQVSTAFAGNLIGTLTFNGDFTLQSVQVADPSGYDCCAVCANSANCAGYAQAPASQGNVCYYVVTDGRCDATQTFGDTYNYYQLNNPGYIVGNSQCGQLAPVAGPPRTGDFAPGA
ncbi:hypothetical protein Slin15195_G086540 [Septoria linicola]|uniref:Apple domain-containing protein n=1 Tax=Septoria linicola TaxID=215465 RepID=A0A9Q9ELR7_9PEZI|nr:hypothetical protein Slin14017_G089130 [Septoria linicola]USW55335.1 hypothetical protein Slin15195_G086540 [Septoria linicola]